MISLFDFCPACGEQMVRKEGEKTFIARCQKCGSEIEFDKCFVGDLTYLEDFESKYPNLIKINGAPPVCVKVLYPEFESKLDCRATNCKYCWLEVVPNGKS